MRGESVDGLGKKYEVNYKLFLTRESRIFRIVEYEENKYEKTSDSISFIINIVSGCF